MAADARNPGIYSRFVRIVKIVLPLLAVGLLSTVFLFQRDGGFDGQVVFSDIDRNGLGDGLTVRNPEITGVSSGGDAFRISATTATPDGPRPKEIEFTGLNARTDCQSGETLTVQADQGIVNVRDQHMTVEGNVVIDTSDGYRGETDQAVVNLRDGWFETAGPITIDGPLGTIDAGRMRIEERDGEDNSENNRHFLFENGVKLVFLPDGEE